MSFKRVSMAFILFAVLIGAVSLADPASARKPGRFGLGVQLGEPAGISGKYWLSGTTAIDGVVAWSFPDEGALHLQGDFLIHTFDLFAVEQGTLPFYYGIGGRVRFESGDDRIGVRFPIGLDYLFENTPIDIYLELAPILDLAPKTRIESNGGFGFRYYF